jgi:hypothetical protein
MSVGRAAWSIPHYNVLVHFEHSPKVVTTFLYVMLTKFINDINTVT